MNKIRKIIRRALLDLRIFYAGFKNWAIEKRKIDVLLFPIFYTLWFAIAASVMVLIICVITYATIKIIKEIDGDIKPQIHYIHIPDYSDKYLEKLAECESGNKHDTVIVDVNNKESAGLFQYQYALLEDYFKDNFDIELTYTQYLDVATHPEITKSITKHIIDTKYRGGWRNWKNCNLILYGI